MAFPRVRICVQRPNFRPPFAAANVASGKNAVEMSTEHWGVVQALKSESVQLVPFSSLKLTSGPPLEASISIDVYRPQANPPVAQLVEVRPRWPTGRRCQAAPSHCAMVRSHGFWPLAVGTVP